MITDAIVRALEPKPGARQWIQSDHERGDDPEKTCRSFGIKVMASGRKTYVVSYYVAGLEREYVIGDAKDIKCAAARKIARQVRQKAKDGIDPQGARVAAREAPTVKALAERYAEEHLPKKRPSSQRNDRTMLDNWIRPQLGSMKVEAVRPRHIEDLHRKITKAGTPIVANRVVACLSKMFSLAIRWEWRQGTNPVENAVERNVETRRKVYLSREQIARLSEALAAYSDQGVADAVRLLLLTGARRSEVLGARWDQFDLEAGKWTKPASTTKQAQEHEVPLSAPALEILARRRESVTGDFVFPGRGDNPHLTEIKKGWAVLCKAAGIEGVRPHDLRHTYASLLVSSGKTLPLIGALLGHSQVSTTNRYAHLYSDPLREAVEQLGAVVTGGNKTAEVVPLRQKG